MLCSHAQALTNSVLWVQDRHFCWELAETTGLFFVFLPSSVHFLRLLGHHHLTCLGIEEAGEFGYGLDLAFSSGTFYFWGGF